MISEVRVQVGVAQQGSGWVIGGRVSAEERLRLQLQQGGQVSPALRHQDRCGCVVHQLLPWTNQRESQRQRVTMTTGRQGSGPHKYRRVLPVWFVLLLSSLPLGTSSDSS